MEREDNEWLERLNRGEDPATKTVFLLYNRRLAYYCQKHFRLSREDAEEVISDVFLHIFQWLAAGNRFKNMTHLGNFLFVSTRNAALNFVRSAAKKAKRKSEYDADPLTGPDDGFNALVEGEILQLIFNAVENLPPECKKIFKMLYIDGLHYYEIADILGLSVQTVRNQKSRAIMLLRKHLIGPLMVITYLLSFAR